MKKRRLIEENYFHLKDINFNQVKFSSIDKLELTAYEEQSESNNKQISNKSTERINSPKRTKHRPTPLVIPPDVNARFHKPICVWPTINEINEKSNNVPYTPPPMLSPVKTNSSYYWHILTGNLTPKTINNNFFSPRKNLVTDNQQSVTLNQPPPPPQQQKTTLLNNQKPILNNKNRSFDFLNENNYIPTPSTAYEPLDNCLLDVETTIFDFSNYSNSSSVPAHINIGVQYQARIPAFNSNKQDAELHYKNERACKVWSPSILEKITISNMNSEESKQCKAITNSKRKTNLLKELELYLELSCSACINGNGRNKEYAYHILYQNNGDLNKSIKQLLNAQPIMKPDHPLYNYKYAETDVWTCEEIQSYYDALIKYDKDFLTISKQMENKTVKQCIEFYYLWKKVCSEEYRRHRILRRKKEQEGIFYISSNSKI